MIQFLKKLSAALLLTLFIGAVPVMASGKMEIKIGERVDFVGESNQSSPTYKWVVKKDDEILSTQSNRNFSYVFAQQGEYVVNLTATSGSVVENTTVHVLAGDRYSRPVVTDEEGGVISPANPSSLYLYLDTLPPKDAENQITLLGESGKVQFLMSQSTGEILEYRIDKNIFVDSDGNGTANDDIDNADDDSYLTGGAWTAEYRQDESSRIAAEVTLVDTLGKKVKQQVAILFKEHRTTGDPVAKWEILPTPGDDGNVHLYEDPHTVSFYARPSEGNILEYRIDKNIFMDSDGDGDPANDIDNLNDISFKTGDVFEVEYPKTDEQIIAQLIVVGEGGKGSRIQKGLVFGEKPEPFLPPVVPSASGIRLSADKVFVVKGDPVTFTVAGLSQSLDQYTFEWDFDGDGEIDKETEGVNTVEHIYDFPGVPLASVTITDQESNTADYSLEILVKDAAATKADFTFEVDGNTVHFTNLSTVSDKLSDKTLDYQWSFGETDPDSYEAQKSKIGEENPSYDYPNAGTYLVTLTVTDSDQVTDSKTAEVEVLQDATGAVGEEGGAEGGEGIVEPDGESPLFIKLLKFALYLILIVVGLVILIVGGALIFFKIQQPDLTFEELVDELKAKILSAMGVHEMDVPPSDMPPQPPSDIPAPPSEPSEPAEDVSEEPPAQEAPQPAEPAKPVGEGEGKKPSWMKDKEVIEGEAEDVSDEKKGDDDNEPPSEPPVPPADGGGKPPSEPLTGETDAPASEKGPVPDWLKGV